MSRIANYIALEMKKYSDCAFVHFAIALNELETKYILTHYTLTHDDEVMIP